MSARLREIVRKRRLLVVRTWRGYHHLKSRPVGVAIVAATLVAIGPGKLLRVGYRSGLIVMAVLRLIRIFRSLR